MCKTKSLVPAKSLLVSCENCGYVEVYNPSILEGKKGQPGTIPDLFCG
ncbi:zinc ribbon domain-containing protein [Fictibacillus solisalsi]|nr:zinc ribbon domain-containing protein [Fictibacillus solisalsi]